MKKNDYLKSIRMNDASVRALLENMENGAQPVESSKRTEDRSPLHLSDIPVVVTHPDGAIARFLICIRNISSGGLSFIHGSFLYPGSKVVVQTPTIWGHVEHLAGRITNCRHVEGQVHEVGVKFDKRWDRRRFITLPGETPLDRDPDVHERNELAGQVLYVDQSLAEGKLLAFHLKESRVIIMTATSCNDAIEKFKSNPIDLIMLSSSIPGEGEASAIETVRSAGFKGPIVLVYNSAEATNADARVETGAVTTLTKPYSPASLIEALRCGLSQSGASGEGPIYSELASNPDAVELVEFYLGYVEEIAGGLREAIEKDEYESALKSCRTLMETGAGYGFSPISVSAKSAVTDLTASMSINESITEIQRLLGVCARIGAKSAPSS
jgi:CheY-like chemotaxis protein